MFCLFEEDYFKHKKCDKSCEYFDKCSRRKNKDKYLAELKQMQQELKKSNAHSIGELQIYQSYSLEQKINLTKERIDAWYKHWDGMVYISFSGGKDSTVLLDLVRNVCGYKDIPAVFVDTGLEYPEIREFVKTFDNVEIVKPKYTFKQVIKKYGYPFISKEVSNCVQGARKYLKEYNKRQQSLTDRQTDRQTNTKCKLYGGSIGNRKENKQKESRLSSSKNGNYP